MKRFVCLVSVIAIFHSAFSQATLPVTTDKTTSLIFPFPILHVDRGTKDILVQIVKESDNLLLVKAGCRNFSPTNLSVLTSDGSVYSFLLRYDSLPVALVYKVPVQLKASIQTYANGIIDNRQSMRGIKNKSWDVISKVTGIYIKDEIIYYQLSILNESSIDYDIDFLRFYIRDKRKSKRTATQENELKPVYIAGNTREVKANGRSILVVALEKFTIPDGKFLAIEIGEKNGGRNLVMKVKNNKIIKAIQLPDLR
jgi:conjugative transposon TraN protein